jgi:hypothetical protein
VSDEEEVRSQLENSPYIKRGTLKHDMTERGGVPLSVFTWRDQGGVLNRTYLQDGKVLQMEIGLDYHVTLGEIVDKYGSPEYVYAYTDWHAEYNVLLIYPAQGLEVQSYTYSTEIQKYLRGVDVAVISRDMKATDVTYYAPTTLRKSLEDVFLLPSDAVEYHIANSHKWTGFGQVRLAP